MVKMMRLLAVVCLVAAMAAPVMAVVASRATCTELARRCRDHTAVVVSRILTVIKIQAMTAGRDRVPGVPIRIAPDAVQECGSI